MRLWLSCWSSLSLNTANRLVMRWGNRSIRCTATWANFPNTLCSTLVWLHINKLVDISSLRSCTQRNAFPSVQTPLLLRTCKLVYPPNCADANWYFQMSANKIVRIFICANTYGTLLVVHKLWEANSAKFFHCFHKVLSANAAKLTKHMKYTHLDIYKDHKIYKFWLSYLW